MRVVDIDDTHRLRDIREKPLMRSFINAGIYVFDPDIVQYIPPISRWISPTCSRSC